MGRKTKIDWCDASWNPVTGCLHDCDYCFARRIAARFGAHVKNWQWEQIHELEAPWETTLYQADRVTVEKKSPCPYPFDFEPTFHKYRLDEPQKWKKPKTVFVCSMADLFGKWVPDGWIDQVFQSCMKAPQHRYLFLTKNPKRYSQLYDRGILPAGNLDMWLGTTVTRPGEYFFCEKQANTFVSIEPMLERFTEKAAADVTCADWVILGAETGNRKDKVTVEKEWVMDIARECRAWGRPVFMKESLRDIIGADFAQEYPRWWRP